MEYKDNIPNEEYHSMKHLGSSDIKLIDQKSVLHYLESKKKVNAPSPAMEFGTAVHTAVLEPELLSSSYAVSQKFDLRTKAGKISKAKFEAENEGKTIINQEQFEKIHAIKNSVLSHPVAPLLLKGGIAERSFFWNDPATDLPLKCRPDYYFDDIIVDLKTTRDASSESFAKDMYNFGYHISAAHYCNGVQAVTNRPVKAFIFLCVESETPHAIALYTLNAESMNLGRIVIERALLKYQSYLENPESVFSGYPSEIQEISLPNWAFSKTNNKD